MYDLGYRESYIPPLASVRTQTEPFHSISLKNGKLLKADNTGRIASRYQNTETEINVESSLPFLM